MGRTVYEAQHSANEVEYIEGGIDWLTLTLPADEPTGELWIQQGLRVIDTIGRGGYEIKPRSMQGYYGASAGNCFVGSREDGHMMQLTGAHANDHFASVFRLDAHVSRIDVQCTAKFKVMPTNIAIRSYGDASTNNKTLPEGRRRRLVIIRGNDGGDTFYLGSPSSDQRGRIYNKAVQSESPKYARCWRYEVVYRNDLATQLSRTVPYPLETRAKWAEEMVYRWYDKRGVHNCGIDHEIDVYLPLSSPIPSDVERKLNWLHKQVGPTVRYLIEAGYRDTILTSLGLTGAVSPDSSDS
jgi:hypothetical protein